MRLMRFFAAASLTLSAAAALRPPLARAANPDTTADQVFGQADLTHNLANRGSTPSAASLNAPQDEAFDPFGNLYIADSANNRVLEFDTPLTTDLVADRVFGQPDMASTQANQGGGPTASHLSRPTNLAFDKQGNLFVADHNNNRVLEYNSPLSTDRTADHVFGQADFTSNSPNRGGSPSSSTLFHPGGLVLDGQDNLYVADTDNHRLLEFDHVWPPAAQPTANRLFGQSTYADHLPNRGGSPSEFTLIYPDAVALGPQGNLYVADYGNNRVLEYDTPLTTDTTADHVFGQADMTHNAANRGGSPSGDSLSGPDGLALDAQDHLYVADYNNNRVLEYDTPLTTTAGLVFGQANMTDNSANRGGSASADGLFGPVDLALDGASNLFVADYNNHRVLVYDVPLAYGVPVLSALSPASLAVGSPAFSLTVNGSGFQASSVVRWNGGSRPTTFVNHTQLTAQLSAADIAGGPLAVTVFTPAPGGGPSNVLNLGLYVRAGHDPTADLELGQPDFASRDGNNALLPGDSHLHYPAGLAVDPHSGRLFVADAENSRVLSWPNALALANGQPADLVIGQPNFLAETYSTGGISAASLFGPAGIALDQQGNLYVADYGDNRVLEYDNPLTHDTRADHVFGQADFTHGVYTSTVNAATLSYPYGVAVDAQGHLYVSDRFNNRVLEYDAPLTHDAIADHVLGQPTMFTNAANSSGVTAATLNEPLAMAFDAQGRLYVADTNNNRVLEYDAPLNNPSANRVFGQPDFSQHNPNLGGSPRADCLFGPAAVAVDVFGNLYVSDQLNHRVLEYVAPLTDPIADRVFGQVDFIHHDFNQGGSPTANSLFGPNGLALDAHNNLYVADNENSRVLEFDWGVGNVRLPIVQR